MKNETLTIDSPNAAETNISLEKAVKGKKTHYGVALTVISFYLAMPGFLLLLFLATSGMMEVKSFMDISVDPKYYLFLCWWAAAGLVFTCCGLYINHRECQKALRAIRNGK